MDFSQQERNSGRKFGGIVFVVVLHIVIIYALVTGLATKAIEVIKGPIETKVIEEIKPPPPDNLPPPPPPKMVAPPPPFIPPPEVVVATPQANPIANMTAVRPDTPFQPPVRRTEGPKTAAVVNANACAPEYPASAERDELEGTSLVAFLIGVDGRVKQSKVEKSSGYKVLDNAAISAFSRCKYTPATADGVAQEGWATIRYVWKLN
jgi:periplasmic protein TonB